MAKNIEPKLKKIGDYLKLEEDTVFTIPAYQRAYSWGINNCDKLWQDINDYVEGGSKDRYFFGTIIINCQEDDTKYDLIDGQQRTTTFLLLLKALLVRINAAIERTICDEDSAGLCRGLQERRRRIMGILYKAETEDISDRPDNIKDTVICSRTPILENRSINEQYKTELQTILKATDYVTAKENVVKIKYKQKDNRYTNFFRNYKFFHNKISELSDSQLNNIAKSITDNCEVIEIKSWQVEQAITMFNSLNSDGLPLYDSDIISAQLYAAAKVAGKEAEFKESWEQLNELIGELENANIADINAILTQYMYYVRTRNGDTIRATGAPDVTVPGVRRYYTETNKKIINDPMSMCSDMLKLVRIWAKISSYSQVKVLLKFNENSKLFLASYFYRLKEDEISEESIKPILDCMIRLFALLELVDYGYGVNLLCMEEGIDSSQTSGKLLISVLSAVAEIERENILEQTMNGRREKARQGKWNGGPAPYGYSLKNDTLVIEEDEAEIVRTIFDKFAHTNMGYTGIAKYLNLQGIKKTPRKKTDIEEFSAHFIKILLDNPVYCGKIAYGRRTREKVKGTKSDYKVVHKQDYCLVDGLHEGIIDEELWEKAHEKRRATGVKFASKYGKERTHLLTGIIKCPKCGSGMYANRVCWTKKDGTYKEVMYYACSRNKQERGRSCDYSANLKKTDIEPLVIEFIKDLVQDEHFAAEIKRKIGLQVDTTKIDMEIHNYENKLKEVELNKARLEREIDSLPIDVAHRERKIHDMTLRLDGLYDTIAEIEVNIEDAKTRRKSVEAEFITMENIYKILQHFNELYDIMSDEEKKELIFTLVNEIQIYPEGESEIPLKSMKFNFPVYKDGKEVREIILNNGNNVKTLVVLRRN